MGKISAQPSITTLTGSELLTFVQSAQSRKGTLSNLLTYISSTSLDNSISYTVRNGNNNGYKFGYRSDVIDFPAAYVTPTTSGVVVAFDLFPKGIPGESPDNGFAWHDVCSTDITINGTDIQTARLAISSTSSYVGSFAYGAATLLPFQICMSASGSPVASFSANNIGDMNLLGRARFGDISTTPTAFVTTGSTTSTPGLVIGQGLTISPVNGALEVDGSGDLYFVKSGSRVKLN